MVRGGTLYFRCSKCRPARSVQEDAHSAVAVAIRSGRLAHPSNFACEDCGGVASQYDHRDYSKPLEVAPVCAGCNVRRGPAINHTARPVGRPRGAYKWQKPAAWRLAQAAQSGLVGAHPTTHASYATSEVLPLDGGVLPVTAGASFSVN